MAKPATLDGYSDQYTLDCERVPYMLEAFMAGDRGFLRNATVREGAMPARPLTNGQDSK